MTQCPLIDELYFTGIDEREREVGREIVVVLLLFLIATQGSPDGDGMLRKKGNSSSVMTGMWKKKGEMKNGKKRKGGGVAGKTGLLMD